MKRNSLRPPSKDANKDDQQIENTDEEQIVERIKASSSNADANLSANGFEDTAIIESPPDKRFLGSTQKYVVRVWSFYFHCFIMSHRVQFLELTKTVKD